MSQSRDIVLLLTHSGDYFTVDRVAKALSKKGARPFRLDTDRFPLSVQLATRIATEGASYLEYAGESISSERVCSVWMRRIWTPTLGEELDPQFQESCARESLAALNGFFDQLRNCLWVDDLERISVAENKLRQLRVATEVGLKIPQTLVTNNAKQAREFFQQLAGKMVAKLLTPLSYSMEASSFFVYTNAVSEQDLQEAELLRYSPMVFQEQIPKRRELRVTFVAGKLFVGALDASGYAAATMDWRRARPEKCHWEEEELPAEVAGCLQKLMAEFGLLFGAIDLIETPDREYVFLEVNPTGEWGMLERDLNYPISEAIASALLSENDSFDYYPQPG